MRRNKLTAHAANHAFGQALIVFSIILLLVVMGLLAVTIKKRNSDWCVLALLVAYFAIACEIGAAGFLW